MKTEQNLVMSTLLEDLHIEAVLDRGFLEPGAFSSDIHAHAYYEVIIQTAGTFCVELADGTSLPMQAGSICLIPPGQYHSVRPGSEAPQKLAIRFHYTRRLKQKEAAPLYLRLHSALEGYKQACVLTNQQPLQKKSLEIREEFSSVALASNLYLHTLLTQFFVLLLRSLCKNAQDIPPVSRTEDHEARRLMIEDYLDTNYTRQITQDDLARYMNLSRRQLSRVLESSFATSFRQLLVQIRMNRAAQLLRQTEQPIEKIAYAVGYTSLSGFCDAFRKMYGLSASAYRKQS